MFNFFVTPRRRIANGGQGPSSVDVMHREVQCEEIDSRDHVQFELPLFNIVILDPRWHVEIR